MEAKEDLHEWRIRLAEEAAPGLECRTIRICVRRVMADCHLRLDRQALMKLIEKEDEEFVCIVSHGDAELLETGLLSCRYHCAPEWAGLCNGSLCRVIGSLLPHVLHESGIGSDQTGLLRYRNFCQNKCVLFLQHKERNIRLVSECLYRRIAVACVSDVCQARHSGRRRGLYGVCVDVASLFEGLLFRCQGLSMTLCTM